MPLGAESDRSVFETFRGTLSSESSLLRTGEGKSGPAGQFTLRVYVPPEFVGRAWACPLSPTEERKVKRGVTHSEERRQKKITLGRFGILPPSSGAQLLPPSVRHFCCRDDRFVHRFDWRFGRGIISCVLPTSSLLGQSDAGAEIATCQLTNQKAIVLLF